MRFGSAGEPLTWYISHPAKNGPSIAHRSRLPSEVSTNAPLRVPTSTRMRLMTDLLRSGETRLRAFPGFCRLDGAVARRRVGHQRPQKFAGRIAHPVDR